MVLLDLRMPGQHGLQTLKEIKRMVPHAAVVVVTGYAADVPISLVTDGMVNLILEKPLEYDALTQAVSEVLSKV